jgi:hypothetical protein
MTSSRNRNTVRVPCGGNVPTTQKVDDLFVSIDLTEDVAYVVHDCSSTLRWREISRADAELLVAMGDVADVPAGDTKVPMVGGEQPWASIVTDGSDPLGWFPYVKGRRARARYQEGRGAQSNRA